MTTHKTVIYTIEYEYESEEDYIANTEYIVDYVEGLIPNATVKVGLNQKIL